MGKRAKTSRKGKKAWRANISTADVDELFAKQAQDERSGGALVSQPSESLFFVDKSKVYLEPPSADPRNVRGKIGGGIFLTFRSLADTNIQRKTTKHRGKLLQCDSILQRNTLIPTLRTPLKGKKKRKERDGAKPPVKDKQRLLSMDVQQPDVKPIASIWEEKDVSFGNSGPASSQNQNAIRNNRYKKRLRVEAIPLQVDLPGCSYNPTFGDHQEALGLAVAQEFRKVYQKDLQPEPVARIVDGSIVEEEDLFFLEADNGVEEEEEEGAGAAASDHGKSRAVKVKKLTRAELNKRSRRRQNSKLESEKKKALKFQKDIQRLPDIVEDIKSEEQAKEKLWLRRTVSRKERQASQPPRLGKYRFKPEPVQVLLTEEVTGSLRKLKACYTLARDRFKSYQRLGILEPRVLVRRKVSRKRVEYIPGTKGQKEREMHAATLAERAAQKNALAVIPL